MVSYCSSKEVGTLAVTLHNLIFFQREGAYSLPVSLQCFVLFQTMAGHLQ